MDMEPCPSLFCFFCTMKEPDSSLRRSEITKCFEEMPLRDDQQHVLVLSGIWNIAMNQPDDPEFPTLGIFKCMATFISNGIHHRDWLLKDQNVYIPYYAAHIIGSYTMNKAEFAETAVSSGVVPPLMELLRGKLSWVEQRVAIRALGHLASYETTFAALADYETEVVELAMKIASTGNDLVYMEFVKEKKKRRLSYHCDLLTRGAGGVEMENRKAEEWASQLQCWSIHLLNCFASKGLYLDLICKESFLKDLCDMWGGLMNQSSPGGVGLIRILCHCKTGRRSISECKYVLETLCNLSRSSDDWQYMGIDCLLLLIEDPDTRFKVMEVATMFLVDLVEVRSLGGRKVVGETITKALLLNYRGKKSNSKPFSNNSVEVERALSSIWDLKVQRRKKERTLSKEDVGDKRVLVNLLKHEGNEKFRSGEIEEAILKYTEALILCPLRITKERMILYSNRAQCYLLLGDAEAAISDSTRALCLSDPVNSHVKSLWRRSQAYDMKGSAKESLMDCALFVNGWIKSNKEKKNKVPYYAARMISKQINATWLFAAAEAKYSRKEEKEPVYHDDHKTPISDLSIIIEEPDHGSEM